MPLVSRVLDPEPIRSLADYRERGGGRGLEAATRMGPDATIEEVAAAGLRGRGGAGFPTGVKWRTVRDHAAGAAVPPTVVVNAAEGEPGTFKDRIILRTNPYRVIEGALIGCLAVGADTLVLALKGSFEQELGRLRGALAEVNDAGWVDGVAIEVVEGPEEYLFGEETALLEVVNGRHPFPRIAPPFRHGVDEAGDATASAAGVVLAAEGAATPAPPTLVNNTETFAHAALVLAEGPEWFRAAGTADSPGTIVCTVTGHTVRHGVGEFAMGTTLREVIDEIGGGAEHGGVVAVLSGVANPFLPGWAVDTPLTYEHMQEAGSGLGAAGFIVFDETADVVAAAHAASRFLAIESCGQCTPCKQDGQTLAALLERLRNGEADDIAVLDLSKRAESVADEARCYLALQHQAVVESLLHLFPAEIDAHRGGRKVAGPELIAPIVDIVDGVAVLHEEHRRKQPDWTYDERDSGQSPADRFDQSQGEVPIDRSQLRR